LSVHPSERWKRVEILYHAALQRPRGERAAFLGEACAGDEALRLEVESLLAQPASDAGFLGTPALAVAARGVGPQSSGAMLAAGHALGPYTILGLLGAGGMGEVYRARDSQLGREVAIKMLPAAFLGDPDRLARFERESRVLASLNHPNIAAIYAVEPIDAGRALVLELVEGPTLAERLARGPVPLDEALRISTQIADALEAAHEKGIVHRDLKPANIKLRPDGPVKVLDFGLAKAVATDASSPDLTKSPTVSAGGTGDRVIGTPAYMSPEQARGQAVDKRTDIWAFGCVLFEMLTGRPAFAGPTITDTLAAVIEREPDWALLAVATPASLQRLLRRCLEKDPKRRLRDIGDARLDIQEAFDQPDVRPQHVSRSKLPVRTWAPIAATLLVVAGIGSLWLDRRGLSDTRVIRSSIIPPANLANLPPQRLALSPDGRRLAVTAPDATGRTVLWVRSLDGAAAQPLVGTDGAMTPFWSPDGRTIAFFTSADGKLKRVDASGGAVLTVTDSLPIGGTWNSDGVILLVQEPGTLSRVSASDGTARPVVRMGVGMSIGSPWFLPDGRHFLYDVGTGGNKVVGVYVGSLDSTERTRLLDEGANAQYAAGQLLFTRGDTLLAQPFDLARLTLTGEAVPLAEGVQTYASNLGAFSVSQNGILLFQNARSEESRLAWYNRAGQQTATVGERINSTWGSETALSPDSRSAVVVVSEDGRSANDLWVFDTREGLRNRLTFDPAREHMPVWSADGRTVAFGRQGKAGFDVFRKAANGSGAEELLLSDGSQDFPESWSPDGRFLTYDVGDPPPPNRRDLWVLPLEGDRKPFPLMRTPFAEMQSQFSPDGRWIAFASNESGRFEVYVTAFADRPKGGEGQRSPNPTPKWQVSTTGGIHPRWRRDGRELFYLAGDTLMAASVAADANHFSVGRVERLFDARPVHPANNANLPFTVYDVSADGQRFLINTVDDSAGVAPLTLIVNWPALLRK
jgi:eukaryotic-like serine/threonine-protein kinase